MRTARAVRIVSRLATQNPLAGGRNGWKTDISGTSPSDRFWPKADCRIRDRLRT